MSIENLRFKPSFQAKIIVSVVTLLILLPAITLVFVHRSSMEALSTESRKALSTADALFQNSLSLRSRQLIARYKSIAGESPFQAVSGTGDAKTVRNDL